MLPSSSSLLLCELRSASSALAEPKSSFRQNHADTPKCDDVDGSHTVYSTTLASLITISNRNEGSNCVTPQLLRRGYAEHMHSRSLGWEARSLMEHTHTHTQSLLDASSLHKHVGIGCCVRRSKKTKSTSAHNAFTSSVQRDTKAARDPSGRRLMAFVASLLQAARCDAVREHHPQTNRLPARPRNLRPATKIVASTSNPRRTCRVRPRMIAAWTTTLRAEASQRAVAGDVRPVPEAPCVAVTSKVKLPKR